MVLYPTADEVRQRQQQAAAYAAQSMASQQNQRTQQTTPYLSSNQQNLLVAALNSQAGRKQKSYPATNSNSDTKQSTTTTTGQQLTMNGANGDGLFMSPQQAELDNFNGEFTPDLDYLDGDSFDFENADLGGEMIGALPGESNGDLSSGNDLHDKRKNSEEFSDEEGDAKRQETQEGEKGAKKPGRKPLTSEPTTVSSTQIRSINFII